MNSEDRQALISICIPVFNDWTAVNLLLHEIGRLAEMHPWIVDVVIVNDGSTEMRGDTIAMPIPGINSVKVIELSRNLGHQRAITIGLCHINSEPPPDAIVVMDGDGEDSPEGMTTLTSEFLNSDRSKMIFAKRSRRKEGALFLAFYQLYKFLYRLFTGHKIEFGNFSVCDIAHVRKLVCVSEIWNTYPAAVLKARIPMRLIPIEKAKRLDGSSKMNFPALIVHGLGAISVFADIIGARALIASAITGILLLLIFIAGLALNLFVNLPEWVLYSSVFFIILLINVFFLSLFFAFITLQGRNVANFIPIRDYKYFISRIIKIEEPGFD